MWHNELLTKDNSVSVHHSNLQYLATELFKVKTNCAPILLNDIFRTKSVPNESVASNLKSQPFFYNHHNPKTVLYGTDTLRDLGPKIWNIIPNDIKNAINCNF